MSYRVLGSIWRASPYWLRRYAIRVYQTTFTVSAAAVVVNPEGKVLILHHILRPATGWGLPGGFLDHGEQADEAIRRELREETGIELIDVRLLRMNTIGRHIEILFSARSNDVGQILSSEIDAIGWYSVEELPDPLPGDQRRSIECVLRAQI